MGGFDPPWHTELFREGIIIEGEKKIITLQLVEIY